MWREIPLLFFVELFKQKNTVVHNNRILIVSPCLIGEFIASVPAIHDFIVRNKDKKIDFLVTPQLKDLAQKISGVNNVFVAKSVYLGRNDSDTIYKKQEFDSYEKIIYLRISEHAYSMASKIKGSEIQTSFRVMFAYVIHLLKNLIIGKIPKRWGSLNFDVLGGKEKHFTVDQVFNFNDEDKKTIDSLDIFEDKKKIIIIHVGTKWIMKRWGRDRWVELLEKINKIGDFKFVFVGGDDDMEDYEYISSKLSFRIYSLIKKISLSDLVLVFKRANYFIGIDSGPSNMAHLVGLRSMVIYGPGPHLFTPTDPMDIFFDKTKGRGLFQMFFESNDSYIKKTNVEEVYRAFIDLYGANCAK
jgi:ADP-heptose:LPS heptosyltransferase